MNDKQAWTRFILALIAFAGVVWGASGNISGVRIKADSAFSMANSNAIEIETNEDSIHDLELRDMAMEINQQNILTGQSEIKAEQKEFARMVISELKRLERVE